MHIRLHPEQFGRASFYIERKSASSNKGADIEGRPAKLSCMLPDEAGWFSFERADRAAEGVESPDFQLFSCCLAKVFVRRSHREIRELRNNRHLLKSLRGVPQVLG
jgi:hypothetical protein